MELFELLIKLFFGIADLPQYQKPRRVFTRGFVMFCVMVAVFELLMLNHIYSGR